MEWLQDADHGFHVLKSSGRTDAEVLEEVGEKTAVWASRLAESPSCRAAESPSSRNRHNAFASRICCGDRHSGSNNRGDATRIATARARDVATFNRLRLYRNSMPRGASACDDVVTE